MQIMIQPRFPPSHFRVNTKKWTKRPYLKSGNLQFYVEKLHRTAWFLSSPLAFVRAGRDGGWFGGPYGFASTVYRLSNFHARSQFTPNNVSKHSGAIFHSVHQMTALKAEATVLVGEHRSFTIHIRKEFPQNGKSS